ncbi:gamma-aminobutyric acid type B receptor subunit 2-like [Halichondria panicea]|uniref:gamma-aminobutyric acid type B receptor subunit 2-like n=1 Tax=Halichondria panicea TaxID=6063 RepID=UPI00312B841E
MLLTLLRLTLLACVAASTDIHFGFVATDNSTATELITPLEIALELINNSSSILPGYQLNYVLWLSECDRTTSLNRFLDVVLEQCNGSSGGPTILGVLGCGCTEADLPVAEIVHRWNMPQISYAGESSVMKGRRRFPNYFLLHSLESTGRALQALLSEFRWTRLAVVTDNSTRFLEVGRSIYSILAYQNITQNHTILGPGNSEESLDLLSGDYRIFFLNTYRETARDIVCYAIEQNLEFPRYVWIINGWYGNDWWVTMGTTRCSNDAIAQFLQDSRVLILRPYSTSEISNDLIVGGTTRAEYYTLYRDTQRSGGTRFIPEHSLIYDSVWTLALALNSTLVNQNPASNSCASGLPLENFTYSSASLGRELRDAVSRTNFKGASGDVMFNENGIRRHSYTLVDQYRNGAGMTVEIGRVDLRVSSGVFNFMYAANEDSTAVYPEVTPMDGTPVKIVTTFELWPVGLYYTLAVIGLIFTFICFLFNIIFRKRKIVRLTSPNLNYFILLGALLVYGTIFVYLIRTTNPQIFKIRCYVLPWTVTLGFMLGFGVVIAKLYRVIHIFKNPSPNRTSMKDWKLMIIVSLFVCYGLLILLLRLVVPQFRVEPFLAINRERPNGLNKLGIVETYCSWRCLGGNPVAYYYQIIYYVCLLVVFALALVFALQTRKVKIEVLNDSKWIAAIVYFSVPITIVFFVVSFVLGSWPHLSGSIYCIGLFSLSTMFLGFVFVPKMVAFAKDPKGENVFSKSKTISAHSTNGTYGIDGRQPTCVTTMDNPLKGNESTDTEVL